jgi:hypothetical protein
VEVAAAAEDETSEMADEPEEVRLSISPLAEEARDSMALEAPARSARSVGRASSLSAGAVVAPVGSGGPATSAAGLNSQRQSPSMSMTPYLDSWARTARAGSTAASR